MEPETMYIVYIERNQPNMTTTTAPITNLSQIVEAAQDTAALIHETAPTFKALRAFRDVAFINLALALNEVNETEEHEALDGFFNEILLESMTATDEQLEQATVTLEKTLKLWNELTGDNKMLELLFLIHLVCEIQEVMHARVQKAKNEGNPKAHAVSAAFRVEANMVVATLTGLQDRLLA